MTASPPVLSLAPDVAFDPALTRNCLSVSPPAEGFSSCIANQVQALINERSTQCSQDKLLAEEAYDSCMRTASQPEDCHDAKLRLEAGCPPPIRPPTVQIFWLEHPPYNPNDYPLVTAGDDRDQLSQLFVCQAFFKPTNAEVISLAGKLLKNLCNVAHGWGTETATYDFAVKVGPEGYWGPPNGDFSHVLRTPEIIVANSNFYGFKGETHVICHANYTTKEGLDIAFFTLFPRDIDHGTHVGALIGNTCHFEWGGLEVSSDRDVEVFYLLPRPLPGPAHPPASDPNPSHQAAHPVPTTTCSIPAHVAACGPAGVLPHADNGCLVTCHDPKHPAYCVPDSCFGNSYTQELCVCKQ
jgi:hypothetical protein